MPAILNATGSCCRFETTAAFGVAGLEYFIRNPSFDKGHHHQDNIPEIVVPDDWYLYWIDNQIFQGAGMVAYRPESGVWHISNAPPAEIPIFFLSGEYCWKIFKAGAAVYYAVTQVVSGLTPGARYRFNAQVYPDIVVDYSGWDKVRPDDIWSAEARAGWSAPDTPWPHAEDGDVEWSKWFNVHNGNFAFGQYNHVWVEFEAPASGEVRVWLECKAKWGFENNWFMDSFSLEQVGGDAQPIPPPVEPTPPPVPPSPTPAQRARIYILLPESIPAEAAQAALKVALEQHATIGFSPDDAGLGDLASRRVICVNPEQIGAGIDQVWYDTHYPGVRFESITYAGDVEDLERQLKALF